MELHLHFQYMLMVWCLIKYKENPELLHSYVIWVIQKSPHIGINRPGICVLRWLDRQFPGHWIGLRAPAEWPPRPPGLLRGGI